MKKSFIAGFIAGKATVIVGLAVAALCVKVKIIDPNLRKEKMIDNGRKRAARKRIAP